MAEGILFIQILRYNIDNLKNKNFGIYYLFKYSIHFCNNDKFPRPCFRRVVEDFQ